MSKSEYQLKCEAKIAPLLGTIWWAADYKTFDLVQLGPLKQWKSDNDPQDFTHVTDDAGNIRWWPHFVDGQVNKGEAVFKEKRDAIAWLIRVCEIKRKEYQGYVDFHTRRIEELTRQLD